VGFSRDWRVGEWKGRPTLLGTLYFRKDRLAEARTYPYRSVEYYDDRHEVTGVALLRRDPEIDLGVLTYDRDSGCCRYALGDPAMPTDLDDPTAPPDALAPSAEESTQFLRMMRHHFPRLYAEAFPSGSDGSLPEAAPPPDEGARGSTPPAPPADEAEATRMAREQTAIQFRRMGERVEALERQNRALLYERDRATCEQQVTQLEAEGYLVRDRAKLVAKLAGLPAAARAAEVEDIRLNYQRDPARVPEVPVAPGRPAGTALDDDGEEVLTERHMPAYHAYLREHPGCDFEDGKRHALSAHKKN
jgi:hypothetical protein